MGKFIDLSGKTFGRLTAIELDPTRSMRGETRWKCKCICGKSKVVKSKKLTTGKTKSCGCLTGGWGGNGLRKYPSHRAMFAYNIKSQYGMSLYEWDLRITEQNGRCLNCLIMFTEKGQRKPVIHHCHMTNRILGIYCGRCNTLEGYLGDEEYQNLLKKKYGRGLEFSDLFLKELCLSVPFQFEVDIKEAA